MKPWGGIKCNGTVALAPMKMKFCVKCRLNEHDIDDIDYKHKQNDLSGLFSFSLFFGSQAWLHNWGVVTVNQFIGLYQIYLSIIVIFIASMQFIIPFWNKKKLRKFGICTDSFQIFIFFMLWSVCNKIADSANWERRKKSTESESESVIEKEYENLDNIMWFMCIRKYTEIYRK